MTKNERAIVIGGSTHGYYDEATGNFRCTHGNWNCKLSILDEIMCRLSLPYEEHEAPYKFLKVLPEEFNFTWESI